MSDTPRGQGVDVSAARDTSVLALTRALRRRGEAGQAVALLDATLGQAHLQAPATSTLSSEVAWLHLERADLFQDSGDLANADHHGLRAVYHFQRAADRGGQAAGALLLGDLAWQGGNPEAAAGWWTRCHALADNVGNPMLGARALAALALLELSMARPERAEAMLAAAEHRAETDLAEALAGKLLDAGSLDLREAAAVETRVVEATVALVRARQAIRAGRWPAARLLLATAADVARREEAPGLYVDALRLDAVVARRQGDPRSASEALGLAADMARAAGMARLAALVDSERVLALADNEEWSDAFALQNAAPPASVAAQPAVHAARLEAFAVLSLRAGNPVAAERSATEAEALRIAAQDFAGSARATALLAEAQLAGGDVATARETAARAVKAAVRAGRIDIEVTAELTGLMAAARAAVPAPERIATARDVLIRADVAGSVPQRIAVRDLLAAALNERGDSKAALQVARDAVALATEHPLLRWRGRAHSRLAASLLASGDADAALAETEVAARLGVQAEDRVTQARALLIGGRALVAQGRLDEAQLALGHAMQVAFALRLPGLAGEAAFAQGDVFLRLKRAREARHVFEQAVDQARKAGAVAAQVRALRGAAAAARLAGDVGGALDQLAAAARLSDGLEADLCWVDSARITCENKQPDKALTLLDAMDASDWPATPAGERLTVLGQAHAMLGDPEQAVGYLRDAVTHLRCGSQRSLGAALFLLGQVEGIRGHGDACGTALAEALIITARLGLPEQHAVRRVIERIQSQAQDSHDV